MWHACHNCERQIVIKCHCKTVHLDIAICHGICPFRLQQNNGLCSMCSSTYILGTTASCLLYSYRDDTPAASIGNDWQPPPKPPIFQTFSLNVVFRFCHSVTKSSNMSILVSITIGLKDIENQWLMYYFSSYLPMFKFLDTLKYGLNNSLSKWNKCSYFYFYFKGLLRKIKHGTVRV